MQKLCDMGKKENAFIGVNCLYHKASTQTKIFENLSKLSGIDNQVLMQEEDYANRVIMLGRNEVKSKTSDLLDNSTENVIKFENMLKAWNV